MATDFRLGIQSYCFRKFKPLSALIDALGQVGLTYVELWPGHQDYKADRETIQKALDDLSSAGITLDFYGATNLGNDEADIRAYLAFGRQAGAKAATVVDVTPEAYTLVDVLSEEYGVNIALHNHGTSHRLGTYDAIEEVFKHTSPRYGVCLDTAWALEAGEDPVKGVERFKDRLFGVHLKDFVFDEDRRHRDVILGTGGLDLPKFMKRLQDVGFDGYLSIEYEGNADDPLEEVQECVRVVNEVIAAL